MKQIANCKQVTGGATAIQYGLIAAQLTAALVKGGTIKLPTATLPRK